MKLLSPLAIAAAAMSFVSADIDIRELQQLQCNANDTAIMVNSSNPFLDPIGLLFDLEDCGGSFGDYFYSNDCFQEELLSFGLSIDCARCWSDFRIDAGNDCFEDCREPFTVDPFNCEECLNRQGNEGSEVALEGCTGLNLFEDNNVDACAVPVNQESSFPFLPLDIQFRINFNCAGFYYEEDEFEACTRAGLVDEFFITEDCLSCVVDHALCVNNFCAFECSEAGVDECFTCVEASPCALEFNECSGLQFYFKAPTLVSFAFASIGSFLSALFFCC